MNKICAKVVSHGRYVAFPNGRGRNSARFVRRYPQADRGNLIDFIYICCFFRAFSHEKNQPHAHITYRESRELTPNLREGCALIIEIPGLFRAGWAPSQARGPPFTLEKSIGLAQGDRWRQDRPQIDTHPGNVG